MFYLLILKKLINLFGAPYKDDQLLHCINDILLQGRDYYVYKTKLASKTPSFLEFLYRK